LSKELQIQLFPCSLLAANVLPSHHVPRLNTEGFGSLDGIPVSLWFSPELYHILLDNVQDFVLSIHFHHPLFFK
jgi:hypothetical protein